MTRMGMAMSTAVLVSVLSACTSTDSNPLSIGVEAPAGAGTAREDGPPPLSAAIASRTRVQLAPIVGSTVESVASLSRRLSARAAQRGIALAASGDTATTHVIKGYFSAITDNGSTSVIYVWDVLDPAGNRLHRIQGQEQAGEGSGWDAVSAETMETIADRTIDEFVTWMASGSS